MDYGIYNTGKGAMPVKSSLGRLYNVCSNILSQTTISKTLPHQHVLYCQVNLCIKVIFNKVIVHLQLVNTYPVGFVSYEIQFSPVPFDRIPYSQLPW